MRRRRNNERLWIFVIILAILSIVGLKYLTPMYVIGPPGLNVAIDSIYFGEYSGGKDAYGSTVTVSSGWYGLKDIPPYPFKWYGNPNPKYVIVYKENFLSNFIGVSNNDIYDKHHGKLYVELSGEPVVDYSKASERLILVPTGDYEGLVYKVKIVPVVFTLTLKTGDADMWFNFRDMAIKLVVWNNVYEYVVPLDKGKVGEILNIPPDWIKLKAMRALSFPMLAWVKPDVVLINERGNRISDESLLIEMRPHMQVIPGAPFQENFALPLYNERGDEYSPRVLSYDEAQRLLEEYFKTGEIDDLVEDIGGLVYTEFQISRFGPYIKERQYPPPILNVPTVWYHPVVNLRITVIWVEFGEYLYTFSKEEADKYGYQQPSEPMVREEQEEYNLDFITWLSKRISEFFGKPMNLFVLVLLLIAIIIVGIVIIILWFEMRQRTMMGLVKELIKRRK